MRETAASLALLPDTPTDAPPELWDAHRAGDRAPTRARPPPSTAAAAVDELAARRRDAARRGRAWIAVGVAAAAVAIVVLAAQVVSLHHQLDQRARLGPSATAAAFDRAAHAPRRARGRARRRPRARRSPGVVLLPDGTRLPPRRPPRAAARRPDVPTVGGHREREDADRRLGRRARPGPGGGQRSTPAARSTASRSRSSTRAASCRRSTRRSRSAQLS